MPRSLQSRLVTILMLLASAAVAAGFVMFALFQQSTAAQIGQAGALSGRGCDAIARAYRFYTAGWSSGAPSLDDAALRRDLRAVVFTALRDRTGIEGGLWQAEAGAIAYAFPTYEGSGPKNDIPVAELPRITSTARAAVADDRPQLASIEAGSQTLLIAACPVPGPIAGLAGWTMTRVHSLGGSTYRQLMTGLLILLGATVGASVLAAMLILTWSRHVRRIEVALGSREGDLPQLEPTGERELDRIVDALNDAGQRLKASRLRAEQLGHAIAQGERLAAVGRVAAGVAHEIRSPIAAMRLKAEMALARDPERKDTALRMVIAQVDRLNDLVARLLSVSEPEPLHPEEIAVPAFLEGCASRFRDRDGRSERPFVIESELDTARFDRSQVERALANLIANALAAADCGKIRLDAGWEQSALVLRVTNHGAPPPEAIAGHLFDPFVTGRPEGAGLGLSIVREVAERHGGRADFTHADGSTTFRMILPCPAS